MTMRVYAFAFHPVGLRIDALPASVWESPLTPSPAAPAQERRVILVV